LALIAEWILIPYGASHSGKMAQSVSAINIGVNTTLSWQCPMTHLLHCQDFHSSPFQRAFPCKMSVTVLWLFKTVICFYACIRVIAIKKAKIMY
jgi:hypothetical protein